MDREALTRDVMSALKAVSLPSGGDVVSAGLVQNVEVGDGGDLRFSFTLRSEDPGTLVRAVRKAAEGVEGIASVKVNVQLPQSAPAQAPEAPARGGGLEPGSVPAPTPKPGLLPQVGHVVAVSSGKGGVGKSMVSTNLAVALARQGLKVGLLDADIYGPNIPLMFGETRRPQVSGAKGQERIEPLETHGVKLMSLGFLLEKEQPAIMRGPLISGILRQFLEQVAWGPLDVMIVDMPPGTGDAQLSLVQTIDLDGAVMVTTPQDVATGDVRRGVKMFERVNTRVLGIVENMSGFTCPSCGETHDLFGRGGGEALAREMGLGFLGSVPLDAAVREAGDTGTPTVAGAPDSAAGQALTAIAAVTLELLRRS
ncbi:MAG: Mrp/NBP35 family ATP-binding protein [Gemmatimonadales bacterium]|jgi:ATP-binding protein involved in chromosome partitioning|nr:MAG: Mrp/NBP35 family ATP-binding protein [Gemmatimonadales bacterium]